MAIITPSAMDAALEGYLVALADAEIALAGWQQEVFMLGAMGGLLCERVHAYNTAALNLWDEQNKALKLIRGLAQAAGGNVAAYIDRALPLEPREPVLFGYSLTQLGGRRVISLSCQPGELLDSTKLKRFGQPAYMPCQTGPECPSPETTLQGIFSTAGGLALRCIRGGAWMALACGIGGALVIASASGGVGWVIRAAGAGIGDVFSSLGGAKEKLETDKRNMEIQRMRTACARKRVAQLSPALSPQDRQKAIVAIDRRCVQLHPMLPYRKSLIQQLVPVMAIGAVIGVIWLVAKFVPPAGPARAREGESDIERRLEARRRAREQRRRAFRGRHRRAA